MVFSEWLLVQMNNTIMVQGSIDEKAFDVVFTSFGVKNFGYKETLNTVFFVYF